MVTLYESYDEKRKSIISMINQQHQNSIVTFVKTETAHFLDRPSEQNKVQRQPLKNNGEFIIFYQKIANHFSWFAILDGFYSILDRFCPLNYCRSLFCEITFFVSYCTYRQRKLVVKWIDVGHTGQKRIPFFRIHFIIFWALSN